MSEPFIAEIKIFAGNFAPRGYALCYGQLLAISQNNALFSLLGTIYGGDGRTTFGLPDLRSRIPIHQGTGSGLSSRQLGARAGDENSLLVTANVRNHTHKLQGTNNNAGDNSPLGRLPAVVAGTNVYSNVGTTLVAMDEDMVAPAGNASPAAVNNVMPFLCIHFIIALIGVYPSRN